MNKTDLPLISVIIPTYNPDYFLLRAISSALEQTYKNIEIIIVDDGSDKINVKSILNKNNYLKKVRYYYKRNGGPSSARNFGVRKSKGELIAFLDDDDEWFKDKLEVQLDFLKKQNCDLIISGLIRKIKGNKDITKNNILSSKKNLFLDFFYGKINEVTPSILIKKTIFLKVKGFNEKLTRKEDHYFLMKVVKSFKLCSVNKPLYFRYKREEGLSNSIRPKDLIKNTKIFLSLCSNEFNLSRKEINKFWSLIYIQVSYYYFLKKNLRLCLKYLKMSFRKYVFNKNIFIMIILLPFIKKPLLILKIRNKLNL